MLPKLNGERHTLRVSNPAFVLAGDVYLRTVEIESDVSVAFLFVSSQRLDATQGKYNSPPFICSFSFAET